VSSANGKRASRRSLAHLLEADFWPGTTSDLPVRTKPLALEERIAPEEDDAAGFQTYIDEHQ
jgi:hypothetical protein